MTSPLPEVARPRYSEGQFLSAVDFTAEQDYHRRAVGRHELGGHTWGLVTGFELIQTDAGGGFVDVFLGPGLAVDGYGRQLVSFETVVLDSSLFASFTDNALRSVWIVYAEQDAAPAADGYADCRDGMPTRIIETVRVLADPVDTGADIVLDGQTAIAEPAAGATIPADRSVPMQELPAEPPLVGWPIRIGTVRWDGGAGQFRTVAEDSLVEGRRYLGSVAAEVLAPARVLRLARRHPETDLDASGFARVEGRLRVNGRINAEREVWLEGYPLRFTYVDGGQGPDAAPVPITAVRDTGSTALEHRLRIRLGDVPVATTLLSVGTGAAATDPTVAEIRADGRVRVPLGPLDLTGVHRQEIELSTAAYGIGTQDALLYLRSPSRFAWYTGGSHEDAPGEPGTGGVKRLELDAEGSLDFGTTLHQMLHLRSTATGEHRYGIGVQTGTLYFRTGNDMCWFRRGSHVDARGSAGGGTVMMKLDENNLLEIFGSTKISADLTVGAGANGTVTSRHVNGKMINSDAVDHLYLNWGTGKDVVIGGSGVPSALEISGRIRALAAGQTSVDTVIKVITTNREVLNGFDALNQRGVPGTWTWNWGTELDEVHSVFVMITGFSLLGPVFTATPARSVSDEVIPQDVWARVNFNNDDFASGEAFCAQSNAPDDGNNRTAITIVAVGRKLS